MAYLRKPEKVTAAPPPLPAELARGAVSVAGFVPRDEQPPVHVHGPDSIYWWRRIRAWRRWQDAVELWGRDNGLDRADLMALGAWPHSPMWFDNPKSIHPTNK